MIKGQVRGRATQPPIILSFPHPGLPPNYVPALMRGSRVKGPLLFWSEGVARTEEQQRAANSAGVW